MSVWVIHEADLRDMLDRVADGEDPSAVYIEAYLNCERHIPDEEEHP